MADEFSVSVAFGKTPEEAVKYFESKIPKGPNGPNGHWNWTDTMRNSHDMAFVVAKATSLDLVKSVHASLANALREGKSYQSFANDIIPELQKRGWWGKGVTVKAGEKEATIDIGHRRLMNIYNTNMHTAYAAGEYMAMKTEVEDYPYWQYVALTGGNRREEHQVLNGKVFRHDDPIWGVIYPPNGWGCQCTVEQLSQWDIDNSGIKVSQTSGGDFETRKTIIQGRHIETTGVRVGNKMMYAQDGWDYSPGEYSVQYQSMLYNKINESFISDSAKKELQRQLDNSINKSFSKFVKDNLVAGVSTGRDAISVAMMPSRIAGKLNSPPILTVSSESMVHSLREKKQMKDKAIPLSEFITLPTNINEWIAKNGIRQENRTDDILIYSESFKDGEKISRYKAVFTRRFKGIDHYTLISITKVGADSMGNGSHEV